MQEQLTQQEVVKEIENVDTRKENATEKTFTQEEVNHLIKSNVDRAVAKAYKEAQSKIDEAEKLKKMNAEQQANYEKEKQEKYIKELEAKINRTSLEKEASSMFANSKINVTNDLLDFVVKDDAESTKTAVESFTKIIDSIVEERVKEALKGRTPTKATTNSTMTKEEFRRLPYSQQVEIYKNNNNLYNELRGD